MRVDFTAGTDDHDRRLESVLRKLLPHQPLGALHKALRKGDIRLNGTKAGPETKVRVGDTVSVWEALAGREVPGPSPKEVPELPAGWILFEGEHLLVVDKPSGLLVHRGDGPSSEPPLDERVRAYLADPSAPSLSFRPGPLHRLDRETSGLVVFSRTLVGARSFSEALASHRVAKTYLAVLLGVLKQTVEVETALSRDTGSRTTAPDPGGLEARSRFTPLADNGLFTLASVALGTGRTHQIRVHAQTLGHPLAGDRKYGGGSTPPGLDVPWLLHAWKLEGPGLPPLEAPLPPVRGAWVKKTFKYSS